MNERMKCERGSFLSDIAPNTVFHSLEKRDRQTGRFYLRRTSTTVAVWVSFVWFHTKSGRRLIEPPRNWPFLALISVVSYYPTVLFSKNPNWLQKVALISGGSYVLTGELLSGVHCTNKLFKVSLYLRLQSDVHFVLNYQTLWLRNVEMQCYMISPQAYSLRNWNFLVFIPFFKGNRMDLTWINRLTSERCEFVKSIHVKFLSQFYSLFDALLWMRQLFLLSFQSSSSSPTTHSLLTEYSEWLRKRGKKSSLFDDFTSFHF